jgi:acyl-CoA synthetase (AMP-forming)/AMP-acid ligase II/serine acetyltransferase
MLPLLKSKRVGIVADNSPSYVDAMLTCLEQGHVAVALRRQNDFERIACATISEVLSPAGTGRWLDRRFSPPQYDGVAQISFTSGTEGAPKGILLTHRALTDVHERLQDAMKLDSSVREYVGIPVYHSFGFARCRVVCAAGGKAFIPEKGFRPTEIVSMLQAGEINAISAVPSLWRLLFAHSTLFGDEGGKVRWIEVGSQYMSWSEKAKLRQLFPNARIVQHYGLTEASRTTLLEVHREDSAVLESVGKPTGQVQVRIERHGCISIKGPHVAVGMLVEGHEAPVTDSDGWLRTNDLGRTEDGYLYFEGRADDVINCGGVKLHPEALERAMHEVLGSSWGFAVARISDAIRGDGVLVLREEGVTLHPDALKAAAVEAMRGQGVNASAAVVVRDIPAIPRTETGKTRRRQLSEMFMSNGRPQTKDRTELSRSEIRKAICASLNVQSIEGTSSFAQLGGDSLSYVQVSLVLERAIGYLPERWESMAIADLECLADQTDGKILASQPSPLLEPSGKAAPLPGGETNRNPADISFWGLVREDYRTNGRSIFSQGFIALFVNRFGNWRMSVRWKVLRAPLTMLYLISIKLCQMLCGIKLDYTVSVGRRVRLEHFGGMILGARRIGNGVIIRQNTTLGIRHLTDLNAKPTIEDNVDIGAGAVIVGDVTIGRGSFIGANSVVYTDIPPYSVVVGNPARITDNRHANSG